MERTYHLYRPLYPFEQDSLTNLFSKIKRGMAISFCSELVDTYDHVTKRKATFIQSYLLSRKNNSFLFLLCLN